MQDNAKTNLMFENLRFCQHYFDRKESIESAYQHAIEETISAGFAPRIPLELYRETPSEYFFLPEAVKFLLRENPFYFLEAGRTVNLPSTSKDCGGMFKLHKFPGMDDSRWVRNQQFIYAKLHPESRTYDIPYGKRFVVDDGSNPEPCFVFPDDIYWNPLSLSDISGIYNPDLLQELLDGNGWSYETWFNKVDAARMAKHNGYDVEQLCLNDYGMINIISHPIGSVFEYNGFVYEVVGKEYNGARKDKISPSFGAAGDRSLSIYQIKETCSYVVVSTTDASSISSFNIKNYDSKFHWLKEREGAEYDIAKYYEEW